jgi:hypothetical protein
MVNGSSARVPVESSSVASVGYAVEARTLEVEFRSGVVYRYFDVPTEIYGGFLAAESKGIFFNCAVKGRFGYARV